MNGLIFSILITIIVLTASIFLNNYVLIGMINSVPAIVVSILSISIVSGILGFCISLNSSSNNCKKSNKGIAIKMAIKNIVYSLIGYFIVYFVSFIRDPFIEILGDGKFGFSFVQSFIVVLNTIISTIINYYSSIKVSCKTSQEEIEQNLKILDKQLDKRPKKKKSMKITIKD